MSQTLLSPLAKPFIPSLNDAFQFSIFNDGIPSLHPVDQRGIVTGISDEAIEDHFPPTMDELEELEEVDYFVQMLADLDLLESREEKSRDFMDVKKRWSTRRKEGANNNNKEHNKGQSSSRINSGHDNGWVGLNGNTELVQCKTDKRNDFDTHNNSARNKSKKEYTTRTSIPKNNVHHKKPIQQPRKQNW